MKLCFIVFIKYNEITKQRFEFQSAKQVLWVKQISVLHCPLLNKWQCKIMIENIKG